MQVLACALVLFCRGYVPQGLCWRQRAGVVGILALGTLWVLGCVLPPFYKGYVPLRLYWRRRVGLGGILTPVTLWECPG